MFGEEKGTAQNEEGGVKDFAAESQKNSRHNGGTVGRSYPPASAILISRYFRYLLRTYFTL